MVQERCTLCSRSLRIEVISPFPNFKYKISSRNNTNCYGGLFCSSHCGTKYIKGVEDMLECYEFNHYKEVIKIQKWWKKMKLTR